MRPVPLASVPRMPLRRRSNAGSRSFRVGKKSGKKCVSAEENATAETRRTPDLSGCGRTHCGDPHDGSDGRQSRMEEEAMLSAVRT